LNWSDIKEEATNKNNYISGEAVDHYTKYEEDFDLLKELNLNAYRFGIAWSRIEPEKDKIDKKEIEHYRNYIKALKKRNIEPVITLWHWTHPLWFEELGGFEKKENIKYFVKFAKTLAPIFKELKVKYIITINEPCVVTSASYIEGRWPPEKKSKLLGFKVLNNLIKAHKEVYKELKKSNHSLQIGVAKNNQDNQLGNNKISTKIAKKIADKSWNYYFLDKIKRQQDFIGLNYYFRNNIVGLKKNLGYKCENPNKDKSDLGWDMYPYGIYNVIKNLDNRYKKPIIITENGLADAKDEKRKWWLDETFKALEKAKKEDLNLIGYLHWSLLDNFEWREGFWPKFGLIDVDRKTMKRTIRDSAYYYKDLICK